METETNIKNQAVVATQVNLRITRWPMLSAVAGPVLFTLAWLILGLIRPGYSLVSRPVSALGVGTNGVWMDSAFVLAGILLIVGVIAIFQGSMRGMGNRLRWVCISLLIIPAIGMVWCGIFTMTNMLLHTIGAQLALGTPVVIFPIVGLILRRLPHWRGFGAWTLLAGPLTMALLIGFAMSVPPSEMATGGGNLGLWQRSLIVEVLGWYTAIGYLAFQQA